MSRVFLVAKSIEGRRRGEAGVKGAFFAFISILDAGLPTFTQNRVGKEAQMFFLSFLPRPKSSPVE
jgi:hypothetical protein